MDNKIIDNQNNIGSQPQIVSVDQEILQPYCPLAILRTWFVAEGESILNSAVGVDNELMSGEEQNEIVDNHPLL